MIRLRPALLVIALAVPSLAAAQSHTPTLTLRGVPVGTVSPTPLALTMAEAIRRGLDQNLAAILQEQRLKGTESTKLAALSELLPHVTGSVRQSDQVISTAAFGFNLPGIPTIIGPFNVFDARIGVSTPLFDARAIGGLKASGALVRAGQADVSDVRETVILAVGVLYLQVEADAARVGSARAQVTTAEALVRLAEDQRAAGLVAGIDVVRQQVQLQSALARVIVFENAYEKRKLSLARAIGLPGGQTYTLATQTRFVPAPPVTIEQAVTDATAHRSDLKAAQARVEAAQSARRAEAAALLPTLHLDADVGALGQRPSDVDRTYSVAASVRVPIFEGGRTKARVQQADAEVKQREAELADIAGGIRYEIEAALLDLKAADAAVSVADNARTLSRQELDQAQDRFRAGVASTLELVEAQESVTAANEAYITSVYEHEVSKGTLARAIGTVEEQFTAWTGEKQSGEKQPGGKQ